MAYLWELYRINMLFRFKSQPKTAVFQKSFCNSGGLMRFVRYKQALCLHIFAI